MQIIAGKPVYSATDLVGFLACNHLTDLERCRQLGLVEKPHRDDPELDIIIKRGYEHEQTYIERLRASGRDVQDISSEWPEGMDAADYYGGQAAATRAAIERGDDVIFQACFFDGTWLGFADFLLRTDDPEAPLSWSYEVADTKLAHSVKAGALLQICVYNEMLEGIQGVYPERMYVALGGKDKETQEFRTADFRAYFRAVRERFLQHVNGPDPVYPPPSPSYPEPVEHCAVCSWDEICRKQRRADDHLSLVANITAKTRASLVARAVETRRGLAGLQLPLEPPLEGTRAEALARVHRQAQLQVQGEDERQDIYELLPPHQAEDGSLDTTKGLLALPQPSPGDLYLDLEGDPFIGDDGMDYLFGLLQPSLTDEQGEPLFHAFWSRDAAGEVTEAGEKAAFEACIDKIMACLEEDPNLHVYHYAPYEPSHFGRLMGRYNTRQDEVDRLFRGDIMVDLYGVVRQGLLASVESYSIKKLEPFYGFERGIELRAAGDSIVEFERWMELGGHGEGVGQEILDQIEAYNRDDVVSTLQLHRWLETLRMELAAQRGEVLPRPELKTGEADEDLAAWLQRVRDVADPLTADIPPDASRDDLSFDQRSRLLLANVLGWHRREQKPEWWAYFSQLELTPDEMIEAKEPLGGLELVGAVEGAPRSFRYRFPPQEFEVGSAPVNPANQKTMPVEELVQDRNEIVLRFPRGRDIEHPSALVPRLIIPTPGHEQRLLDLGRYVLEHGLEGDGDHRAARDLLRRRSPRIVGHRDGAPLRQAGESAGDAAKRLVKELDHTCLAIQGPPGSGKTWIGGRMILELVLQGKTVGVTAGSHKVIGNLLDNVWAAQSDYPEFAQTAVRMRQKPGGDGLPACDVAAPIGSAEEVAAAFIDGAVDVVGGTSWLWASDKIPSGTVDVLFIDEAGQFSLANALAVSAVATSVVLLGDPQQLDQPIKGAHPPGADGSALGHLLDGEAVMPDERGLFMDKTWRLHPDICGYTSEVFYRNELLPEDGNEKQALSGDGWADGEGIRYIAVDHADARNDNASIEEARVIADIVADLLEGRSTWINREGDRASITPSDILVITPYNAQRTLIKAELGMRGEFCGRVPVGTVDKFQGQQAPVSIYSMASSRPEDAPRGMEFLYSLNRLNVATSRARCLTLVVASPALVAARARTPAQMVLANALCRLAEVARAQTEPA